MRKPPAVTQMSEAQQIRVLVHATAPLLELFAEVDSVMSEDDALKTEKLRIGMGRIRRQWEKSRRDLGGE